MSQFFERNKKKGLLALLLLLLKRGRGIAPLVLLVAILGFIFVLPSGYHREDVPWLEKAADKMGLSRFWGGRRGPDFHGFEQAMSDERLKRPPGLLPPISSAMYYGKSAMSYIRGSPSVDKPDGVGDNIAASGGKSVAGVLRPEDAQKMAEGVALKEQELHNALLNHNAAGNNPGAGPGPAGAGNWKGKADDKGANMVRNAVTGPVPGAGAAGGKGRAGGKLDWRKFLGLSAKISDSMDPTKKAEKTTALYQLAQGRAYSVAASPPPGYCDPNRGCPNEAASNISGVPFDGKKKPGGILSAPELGDPDVPMEPDAQVNSLTDQASNLEKEAKQCEAADQQYGPEERLHMDNIKHLSCELGDGTIGDGKTPDPACAGITTHYNCNSGCGANLSACCSVGRQIRSECKAYNQVALQHAQNCPLMGGQASVHDCYAQDNGSCGD